MSRQCFEWDYPGEGLYSEGEVRVITRRGPKGEVEACHLATEAEAAHIRILEELHTMNQLLTTIAQRQS